MRRPRYNKAMELQWFERPGRVTHRLRVRYCECDPMGLAHHASYPVWLEIARTEMLRAGGMSYAELEADGLLLVVARLELRYRRPARYDDELDIEAVTDGVSPGGAAVKLDHRFRILRGGELLTTASTTLVSVDREGRVRSMRG